MSDSVAQHCCWMTSLWILCIFVSGMFIYGWLCRELSQTWKKTQLFTQSLYTFTQVTFHQEHLRYNLVMCWHFRMLWLSLLTTALVLSVSWIFFLHIICLISIVLFHRCWWGTMVEFHVRLSTFWELAFCKHQRWIQHASYRVMANTQAHSHIHFRTGSSTKTEVCDIHSEKNDWATTRGNIYN